MATANSNSIKALVELKRENEQLQETLNFLKMENFEFALKCNSMENILANIQAVTRDNPAKLVEASSNLCSILQACNNAQPINDLSKINEKTFFESTPIKPTQSPEKPKCNKVKPHMVNGHILYIPTINLTRVSEIHTQSNIEISSQHKDESQSSLERSSNTVSPLSKIASESSNDGAEGFNGDNQISDVEEVPDPSASKSPSHSTVLSGTFQEVKIYLNQVSQDSLNEESRNSRKSVSPRRGAKLSRSTRNTYK
jgi:hypothetical protein